MLRESPPVYLAVGRRAFHRVARSLQGRRQGKPIVALRWCPNLQAALKELREGLHGYPTVVVGVSDPRRQADLLRAGALEVLSSTASESEIHRAGDRACARHAARTGSIKSAQDWMRAIAHEIRNPLDGSLRFLRLACEDRPRGKDPLKWVNLARTALSRIQGTVERLLRAGPESGIGVPWRDLASVLDAAVEAAGTHPSRVVSTVERNLADVPDFLLPVFSTLVRNASDASEGEGPIRIDAHRGRGDDLSISVTDEGSGMPPAIRARLGQEPISTKAGGAGVGLQIARALLDRVGGRLRFTKPRAGGTRAVVRLPSRTIRTPSSEATR